LLRKIWQPFYTAYGVVLFVCFTLVFALLISLAAIPGGAAARKRVWMLFNMWAYGYLYLMFMPPRKMNKPEHSDQNFVAVLNHQSYIDSVILFPAVPGYFRPLGKIEMTKIPLFGFVYRQIVLLVDRSSAHSRALSMKLMTRALRRECNVAIFPEGTFNETDVPVIKFYDGAFRMAIAAQQPILPILLPDTADRWQWTAWWKFSPGKNRIFYLPMVSTKGLTQDDLPELRERVRQMMGEALVELGVKKPEVLPANLVLND
jgi:1-acyl-sn-glycerol-3-phosphate acyltransferase